MKDETKQPVTADNESCEVNLTAADNAAFEDSVADKSRVPAAEKRCARMSAIGGQAVLEGVMMRGVTATALAVRNDEGEVLLQTSRNKKPKTKVGKIPILRGVVNFVAMLIVGMKALMKSADAYGTDDEEMPKGFIAGSAVLGIAFAILLFIWLPSLIMDGIVALGCPNYPWLSAIIEGVIRLTLFVVYLVLTALIKDIKRTYMYHGAEHKTINCYEQGLPLTTENVRASSKIHNRCGTTFMFIVLFVTIIVFAFSNWLTVDVFGWTWSGAWWARLLIRLVLLPLIAGISYEVLKFLAWLPDNKFVRALRAPGLLMQKITTKEPDDAMIECAVTAFNAVLAMDADAEIKSVSFDYVPVEKTRARVEAILSEVGAESAETDWILCEVLDCKRGELADKTEMKRVLYNRARSYAKARAEGAPLAYVLGSTEFYGEKIEVNRAVLIPRPETELVAEQAILLLKEKENAAALDVCTGSGCIALALAKNTTAKITASDVSAEAIMVARKNLAGTEVEVIASDMFERIDGTFDVIVSNPPYIAENELSDLQPEVRREPLAALQAGEDGLKFYRIICAQVDARLNAGGALVLELGQGQAMAVSAMLEGFDVTVKKDYSGIERILIAKKKEQFHA